MILQKATSRTIPEHTALSAVQFLSAPGKLGPDPGTAHYCLLTPTKPEMLLQMLLLMLLQKDNVPQLANGLSLGSSVHIIHRASNKWNLFLTQL